MAVSFVLLGQWQVSPHLSPPPPSLSLLSLKSSSVQPASPLPPLPSALLLCGWCNIMSVGEGMACLCAPEGLPTHCWKGKATRAWIPPSPPLFKHPFHSLHRYSARALRDSIVCLAHTPTNAQRRMVITKTRGEDLVWFCVFSPLMCLFWRTHQAHGIHMQLALSSSRHHPFITQHSSSKCRSIPPYLRHDDVLWNWGDVSCQTCHEPEWKNHAQIHLTIGLTNEECSVIQSAQAINQEILSQRAAVLCLTHVVFFQSVWHSGQANSPVSELFVKPWNKFQLAGCFR